MAQLPHDPFSSHDAVPDEDEHHDDHLSSMRLPELRSFAATLDLDTTGKRDDLIGRIRAHQRTDD